MYSQAPGLNRIECTDGLALFLLHAITNVIKEILKYVKSLNHPKDNENQCTRIGIHRKTS